LKQEPGSPESVSSVEYRLRSLLHRLPLEI
jgi:hypothetical protein